MQCLGNVSKYFTISNMKNNWIIRSYTIFPADFNPIDTIFYIFINI